METLLEVGGALVPGEGIRIAVFQAFIDEDANLNPSILLASLDTGVFSHWG
jgi:hypothetical protein